MIGCRRNVKVNGLNDKWIVTRNITAYFRYFELKFTLQQNKNNFNQGLEIHFFIKYVKMSNDISKLLLTTCKQKLFFRLNKFSLVSREKLIGIF